MVRKNLYIPEKNIYKFPFVKICGKIIRDCQAFYIFRRHLVLEKFVGEANLQEYYHSLTHMYRSGIIYKCIYMVGGPVYGSFNSIAAKMESRV